ncbi:hypothetical protein ACFSX9_04375 [Flavobacterium ardleyense]|uniref:Lipoprotein n=1 Tax=Flavobacterium ardleyense TaxID=2038737 RepID=A0ABW5Z573_9FLAO
MRYILVLTTFLVIFGCSSIQKKENLIGNWSSINSSNEINLEFYNDSLIIDQWSVRNNFRWYVDDSYVYFDSSKVENNEKGKRYNYKLVNDTLFLRENKNNFLKFLRINNAFDYFNKSLKLNLPRKLSLIPVLNEDFAYKLYVYSDNKNIVNLKTSDNIFLDINDLERDINVHIANTDLSNVHKIIVILFADTNVSKPDILKIKKTISEVNDIKIFQIFTNDDVDYEKYNWKQKIKWYGVLE